MLLPTDDGYGESLMQEWLSLSNLNIYHQKWQLS
jgi:hypothetical protein